MKFIYFLVLVYCLNAIIDYPTACDCSEHQDQDSCTQHNCLWIKNECRIAQCNERNKENCVNASQFLSLNPKYCYLKDDECEELQECEQLQISLNPNQAREQCQLYQCAYDLVSGYCFKPQSCEDIYDQDTCNTYIMAQNKPFKIESLCYWNEKCLKKEEFINDCNEIQDQLKCEQSGCLYKNEECQELNCESRSLKECNGEYVNHKGKVFTCFEIGGKCEEANISKFHKDVCNQMIGHTFYDKQCQKCNSYSVHQK